MGLSERKGRRIWIGVVIPADRVACVGVILCGHLGVSKDFGIALAALLVVIVYSSPRYGILEGWIRE